MIPEEVQRKWGLQQMTTELTQRTHTADPSAVLDITHYQTSRLSFPSNRGVSEAWTVSLRSWETQERK